MKSIVIQPTANPSWMTFYKEDAITLAEQASFSLEDRAFTIGSCFAEEIRKALEAKDVAVLPDYRRIAIDETRFRIDTLPGRPHMNFYNTFTIRQELERCAGLWTRSPDDIWEVEDRWWGGETAYQDPYRRSVFARTPDALNEAISLVDSVIEDGFRTANAFFITLSLIEVWKKNDNGLVACQRPGYGKGGGTSQTSFHLSTYEKNYENMTSVINLILEQNPDNKVVLTVSPVPLARTFTDSDIFVANTESKSVLRAVAGRICREFENVIYFPSYELVTAVGDDAFQERDGRHVKPAFVNVIMDAFLKANKVG